MCSRYLPECARKAKKNYVSFDVSIQVELNVIEKNGRLGLARRALMEILLFIAEDAISLPVPGNVSVNNMLYYFRGYAGRILRAIWHPSQETLDNSFEPVENCAVCFILSQY